MLTWDTYIIGWHAVGLNLPSYAFVHNAFAAETEGFWPCLGIVVPFAKIGKYDILM